ncbi:hypothetical protein MATL_G00145470 [Megalops atlanticus]|uniref:G-protein coupled receptors family 1 profile domain-containing protein n=1 Tax=Megalops atlanticus TaxID=7932 RepID=A0A9D3TB85_MEGAT|nr:hypothetical protein MATL_G00145470 [Megalops atlanticus]
MQHLNSSSSNSTVSWSTDRVAPSVVMGLCWLIGVPGNIAVVVVIARNFKKENFTLKLMMNLAVSDLLCLITLPVWIYSLLYGWSFGPALCKFVSYLVYCSLYASVLTVTLMSVQRYLTVLYTQCWARLRGTGERVLLVCLWVLACLFASPNIPTRDIVNKRNLMRCQRSCTDELKVTVLLLETLLGFFIPFSILVTSYFCLHKKVNQTAFFSSQRMTKLVTTIVVTFFIFWIPVHVINMVDISTTLLKTSHPDTYKSLKSFRRASGDISKALVFINSCINPFLYAFTSRNLRSNAQQTEEKKAATQTSNV